ncbi:MAG: hypothetical protein B6I20_07440 [Bacteroidetes bacterium 4572_117]|nr:MAG: hypothetical protein B6I20_07440 [Bacteroidetes bacterium 4572_117]
MEIKVKNGIDNLLFGASRELVEKTLGKFDKEYFDDDGNILYQYNKLKLTLTFYKDEGFKLAYIQCSSNEITLFGEKIIGKDLEGVFKLLEEKEISDFEYEDYDSFETYTNEDNWLVLNIEYGEVNEIEIGVIINDDDEYEWKV